MKLRALIAMCSLLPSIHARAASNDALVPPAEVAAAVEQLASPTFAERKSALLFLQQHLIESDAQLLSTDDEESLAQVGTALLFHQRASAWILKVATLPESTRTSQIALLTRKDAKPLFALLFSPNPVSRTEGIRQLAGHHDFDMDPLLAFFLNDEEPTVRLAAMDQIWDRPPSEQAVLILCTQAFGSLADGRMPSRIAGTNAGPAVSFRGQPLGNIHPDIHAAFSQDGPLQTAARMTIVHLNSPLVESHLQQMLSALNDLLHTIPLDQEASLVSYRNELHALMNTVESSHDLSLLPTLISWITLPLNSRRGMIYNSTNDKGYYSVRTDALGAIVALTSQPAADYGLARNATSQVWLSVSADAENEAITKMSKWWTQNADRFTAKVSATP